MSYAGNQSLEPLGLECRVTVINLFVGGDEKSSEGASMERILVASDLSSRSERAVRRAMLLAKESGARLAVVTAIDGDLPMSVGLALKKSAADELSRLCRSISDYPAEIFVDVGETVDVVLQLAEKIDADLIVLGVHRDRPFWDMFSGTTMERVIRATERPVLLVKDPVERAYERILCGIDLSPACSAAAKFSAEIAPNADLVAFHAVHVPYRGFMVHSESTNALQPFLAEAQADLDSWWATAEMPTNCEKPVAEVDSLGRSFATKFDGLKPDLIAVGAHGRAAIAPTILGGFTENLVRKPPADVLIVRR